MGTSHRDTVVSLLNDMLAGELIWLMRYRRHYVMAGGLAGVSMEFPSGDLPPADLLARRIVEMGGEPELDPDDLLSQSRTAYAPRGSVDEMVLEDLQAEKIAIEGYAEVIDFLGDSDLATRLTLQANLDREQARADELVQLLEQVTSGQSLSPRAGKSA